MGKGNTEGYGHTKMEGALLLDIVVGKSSPVLELLAGKDQALLVRRDASDQKIESAKWPWQRVDPP